MNLKGILGLKPPAPLSNPEPSTKSQSPDLGQTKRHGLKMPKLPKSLHLKRPKIVEKLLNLGHNNYVFAPPNTLGEIDAPVGLDDDSEVSEAPVTSVKKQVQNKDVSAPANRTHQLQARQENPASRWPEAGGALSDKELKIQSICRDFKTVLIDAIGEDDGAYNAFSWLANQLCSVRHLLSPHDLAPIAELAIPHLINDPKAIKTFCDRILGEPFNPERLHATSLPLMTAVINVASKRLNTEGVALLLITELCARMDAKTLLTFGNNFPGMSRWLMSTGNARFIVASDKSGKNKEYKQNALHFLTGALGATVSARNRVEYAYIGALHKLITSEKQSLKNAAHNTLDTKLSDFERRFKDTESIPQTSDD